MKVAVAASRSRALRSWAFKQRVVRAHEGFTVRPDAGCYHLDLCEEVTKSEENRKGSSPQSRRNPGKKGP